MAIWDDRDFLLYQRMAAELRQVAAELRIKGQASGAASHSASRLEDYASAIDTNLRVEPL